MMKSKENFYEFELLKEKINRKDVFNFLISALGLVISNVQMAQIIKTTGVTNYKVIIYNILICFAIIFLNIYNIMSRKKLAMNELHIERLEEKNRNLLEVNDGMRCFKHDFNNIIQAIDGYIFLDDMKSLQVYFKSLLEECNHVNSIDLLNCRAIDNPAIYGVLLNKHKIAEENNIEMNIEILLNISELNEKSYTISRMLGILLDNALEATKECEEKIINIQFLQEGKRNVIIIENTYMDKDIDTCKIFEKDYTTKKKSGNSGLGLWKINNILSKDSSFELFTTKDDVMFKQKLEIYA